MGACCQHHQDPTPAAATSRRALLLGAGGAALLGLVGCATNPETGRSQLLLVGDAQLSQMALSAWADMKAKTPISKDPAAGARVIRVGTRIQQAAGRGGEAWEFVVFDTKDLNAFVLPGGRVGVYKGLLDFVENDDQLAAILGHETGHVTAHHSAERASQQMAAQLAGSVLGRGTVGGIYGPPEPPILRFRNGFEQGVAYINPEVSVVGIHIDDYYAPDRGAAAAEQLIGEDVDVIFGAAGETGSGGIKRAAELGTLVIGVDQDEYFTTFGSGETPGAENIVSSALKRVDNAVFQALEQLVGGTDFSGFPGIRVFSALNDGVGFARSRFAS